MNTKDNSCLAGYASIICLPSHFALKVQRMWWSKVLLVSLVCFEFAQTYKHIQYPEPRNVSLVAVGLYNTKKSLIVNSNLSTPSIALSEIINGLRPGSVTILALNNSLSEDIDDFICKIHELHFKSCIFSDLEKYFNFIESTISGSAQSWSLIFFEPSELAREIHARNLAHRLALFIFYWGADKPPKSSAVRFEEPIRAVVITRPRKAA